MPHSKDFITIITQCLGIGENGCTNYFKGGSENIQFNIENDIIKIFFISNGSPITTPLPDFLYQYSSLGNKCIERIEVAANKYFNINQDEEIQIWPANKIRYAYLEANYYQKAGILSSSCMRGKDNQKALNFYVINNVKICVIVTKNNKIKARALLWENVNVVGKKKIYTYLDRVYYSKEMYKSFYKKFAKNNNFLQYPKDNLYIKNINLKNILYLPYTDTFKNLYYKDNIIFSDCSLASLLRPEGEYIKLCSVNNFGYAPQLDKNKILEVFSKKYYTIKDCIYVKKYTGYVHKNSTININNTFYSKFDTKNIYTLSENNYCLKKDVVKEYITNKNIDKTKAKFVKKYNSYIYKDNVVYVNKLPYSKKDELVTIYKNKYYLISQCYDSKVQKTYIPKDKVIRVYKLGFIKKENNQPINIEDFPAEIYGLRNWEIINNIQQENKTPEFIGPYYVDDSCPVITLNTGECIIVEGLKKEYIIRRNKKYYLRHLYKFNNSQQLKLPFEELLKCSK